MIILPRFRDVNGRLLSGASRLRWQEPMRRFSRDGPLAPPGMRPLTARDGTKRASPAAPIWSTTLFRPGRPLLSVPAPRPERRPQEWMAEIMPGWGSSTTAICGGGSPACPARSQRGKRHFPLRSLQRRRAPRVGMHRRICLHLTPIRGSVRLGSRSVTK